MSTRETANYIFERLNEEQLKGFIAMFGQFYLMGNEQPERRKASEVKGILHQYANPELIPLEEGAWERNIAERYKNGEESF